MTYATYSDVNALIMQPLDFTIGAGTDPSSTAVATWLAFADARVNAALKRAGYGTIPATDSNDTALIGGWVARWGALEVATYLQVYDTLPESLRLKWSGFEDFLKGLMDGSIELSSQDPTVNQLSVIMPQVYGVE